MAHDVFISYSTQDKVAADAVCATLESEGLRCWIAPRDILPGADWAECVIDGIEQARVVVLVFSSNANSSPQIKKEVERGVHRGIPIVPVRIEDVLPSKSLEYFISTPHWMDAITPPLEHHIRHLSKSIRLLLNRNAAAATANAPPSDMQQLASRGRASAAAPSRRPMSALAWPVATIVLAALVVGWLCWSWLHPNDQRAASATPPTAPAIAPPTAPIAPPTAPAIAPPTAPIAPPTAPIAPPTAPPVAPAAPAIPPIAAQVVQAAPQPQVAPSPPSPSPASAPLVVPKPTSAPVAAPVSEPVAATSPPPVPHAAPPRPAEPPATNLLAQADALFDRGETVASIDAYTRAIEADAKSAKAYFGRGRARSELSDDDNAIRDLSEAIRLDPSLAAAYAWRAMTWRPDDKDGDKRMADAAEALRLDPKLAIAHVARAVVFGLKRDEDNALKHVQQALQLDDASPYAHAVYAAIVVRTDRQKALQQAMRATQLRSSYSDGHLARAGCRLALQQFAEAHADSSEAIRCAPLNASAFACRGIAAAMQQRQGAIADCNEAIRLRPQDADLYAFRARVFMALGERDKASNDADEAVRLDPKSSLGRVTRANILILSGQDADALEDLDEAIRNDPTDAEAYLLRGGLRMQMGQVNAGSRDLKEAMRLSPQIVDAQLQQQQQQQAEMLRRMQQFNANAPGMPPVFDGGDEQDEQ